MFCLVSFQEQEKRLHHCDHRPGLRVVRRPRSFPGCYVLFPVKLALRQIPVNVYTYAHIGCTVINSGLLCVISGEKSKTRNL